MGMFGKSKEQLERDVEYKGTQIESLEGTVRSLKDDVRKAKFENTHKDADHAMEVKEIELNHEIELSSLDFDHQTAMAELQSETTTQIAKMEESHIIELRTAERRIAELESDTESAIEAGIREATTELNLIKQDIEVAVELATTKKLLDLEKTAKVNEDRRDAEVAKLKKELKAEYETKFAALEKKAANYAEASDYNRGRYEGQVKQIEALTKMNDFMKSFASANLTAALGKLADVSFHVENPAPVMLAPAAPKGGDGKQNGGGDQKK